MRSPAGASRALFASLLVASSLLAGGAAATLAQESGVDVEVPYVDDEGVTRGTIKIGEVGDPFTGFDPAGPPADGSRYVGLTVVFTAADDQPFETNPFGVTLRDTTGTLWSPGFVPRPADSMLPDAQSQAMAPGNRLSGFIGYTVPEDVVIDEILYQPDYFYRAVELVDLVPDAGPAAGTAVPYTADDGASATVTAEVIDPFTDNDPNSPPSDGTRYVMVSTAFENTGERGFVADPYQLILHLADGRLIYSTWIPRPFDTPIPVIESQTLSPGDHISGLLGFNIPADGVVVSVDYVPEQNRRIVVADLAGGVVGPVATTAPAASEAPAESAAPATAAPSAGTAQ